MFSIYSHSIIKIIITHDHLGTNHIRSFSIKCAFFLELEVHKTKKIIKSGFPLTFF